MTNSQRRIALLTGASLAALGLATPSFAAPHDVLLPGGDQTNPGTNTTDNTIDLCTIAAATPECFYGVIDTGVATANATVSNTATGRIYQHDAGPTIVLDMNVAALETAEVGAIAVATGGANAVANATITTNAIEQSAVATTGDAIANLNVAAGGRLLVDMVAVASGTTFASANASNNTAAIQQFAEVTLLGTGTAAANIVNAGSLTVLASASAISTGGAAFASASIDEGISQTAINLGSGDAAAVVDNVGTLNIEAIAFASGNAASADASVSDAIDQFVQAASGDALALIVNDTAGLLNISASAVAIADAGNATASASNFSAIDIFAESTGIGDAAAGVVNDGDLNIAANAVAIAFSNADASASVSSAVEISAYASDGDAVAGLANAGNLTIDANAFASGFTSASADATISQAMYISASANLGGDAAANLTNAAGGSIDIGANAIAGAAFTANASASIETGIEMSANASAGGLAIVNLDNQGALAIHASAAASANNASASASVSSAINMSATVVSGGTAAVNLANGTLGTIDVGAVALATGGTSVDAYASVSHAIYQSADAQISGNATASVVNDGNINVHATASAFGTGDVSASATVTSAVSQYANADIGDATVRFVGAGTYDVGARAVAISTTSSAYANASNEYAIYQVARVATSGNALVSVELNGMDAYASASAQGSFASADAYMYDVIGMYANNTGIGDASAILVNNGALTIAAVADASSTRNSAYASATVSYGISMTANADSGNATVSLTNNGTIDISADAGAVANTYAYAYGAIQNHGIGQYANATNGDALAEIVNAPALSIVANAAATGNSATATATITTAAIYQSVNALGGSAEAVFENNDPVTIAANAIANADVNDGYAYASVSTGIRQDVFASGTTGLGDGYDALAGILNGATGDVAISANADAVGATFASANATVDSGIDQNATALSGAAVALLDNAGSISVVADANASATAGSASAYATVDGLFQFASGATGAAAVVLNSGTFEAGAAANAVATGFAYASVTASGIHQNAVSGSAVFLNDTAGVFDVHATAVATGTSGSAYAEAYGLEQTGATLVFDNLNAFDVVALASVAATSGRASATAIGVEGRGAFGAGSVSIDYFNGGTMNVSAIAVAPSTANAYAIGIDVSQSGPTSLVAVQEEILAGTIVNEGTLHVLASAQGGGTYTTVTAGGATITVTQSSAIATGIRMESGTNNLSVTNSGTLSVDAVTAGNGITEATGIIAVDNGAGLAAAAGSVLTITNDGGDIIVRESLDGGATWRRGMAIDVAAAPNPTVINLLGDGYIYGNIDVQTGDLIAVESGTTYFDGIINPEYVPAGGFTTGYLDSSVAGEGDLVIQNDGNLILADPRLTGDPDIYDGPAYAIVDNFTVATDGTITFELQPTAGGTQPVGTYPQVYANQATLEGTLVADITPAGGLFFDDYFWDNVIDAHVRNGGFDGARCVLDGTYAGSLLVDLDCIEDANANIDLALTRVAFDAVPGLNQNGIAVGSGLECIYDPTLTGGIADLLADLFLFTDPVNYNIALNQLAGEGYANYLQSFPSLGVHYNDLVDRATNCEIPALAGSILECRASAPLHLWGQLDYQWRKADGDDEAGTAKAKRFTGLIGLDANVGNAAIIGGSLGYVTNNTRTSRFDEKVNGDGWQVGLYGAYDPGQFYVKAITTYSWFDGDSTRRVDFNGLAPGATFAGQMSGDPDVNMWTFGLHGGYRIAMGGTSVVTPYLNYDYVNAKLKSFTETGLDGANLTVLGGRSKHSFLTGGVKWATQFGGVVPEVNLGYRYRFGDKRSSFDAAFIGDTACDFEVISAAQKKGTFLAGLSVGGKVGPVDLRIGYEGEFNSDITSHAGNFKIVIPLGGRAAPPPPAPVVAPPPPPPPAPEVAPPPPPPPPAPVERGERGQ